MPASNNLLCLPVHVTYMGRNSLDGVALLCGMAVRGWNPGRTINFLFSVSVQADPGPHPASSVMGAGASFSGMKRPEIGFEQPPASSAKVK
jgi:hypothetical protein